MKILWTPQAIEDLQSIRQFISAEHPETAKTVAMAILTGVQDQLTLFPNVGRPGRIEGTRELIIPRTPFIVPYRVVTNQIQILGVHHEARRWPDQF